jgi:hypothetical protein
MPADSTAQQSRDDSPLTINLYGEAKDTAEWISERMRASPGDVVARALGILYFLLLEEDAKRRVVTESINGGDRRQLNINVRAGDAGTNVQGG